MPKGKIAFVVGHVQWGKSKTLCALTNDDFRVKKIKIDGVEFFIRRMSNDDQPAGYVKFMKSISPTAKPYLIATLCPNFDGTDATTDSILNTLRVNGYELFFWVIEHQFGTSQVVTAEVIQRLRSFGKVAVFSATAEAAARSRSFMQFVLNVVLVQGGV